jgi:DNA-binding XRE family transcriptional regulator
MLKNLDTLFPLHLFRRSLPTQPITTITGPVDLADWLRSTRIAAGITPTELARQSEISRENVYRIERGENITLSTLFEYCRVVGVTIKMELDQ